MVGDVALVMSNNKIALVVSVFSLTSEHINEIINSENYGFGCRYIIN